MFKMISIFPILLLMGIIYINSHNNPKFHYKSTYTRYVARVLYDGTDFKGWQNQGPTLRTIQNTMNAVFSKRFNSPVTVTGAGRTDLGVHAKGQAIHFDLPYPQDDLSHAEFSLNRMLPDDIRIYNVTSAPLGTREQIEIGEPWHATKSAVGKWYSYSFCTNDFVDPTKRLYCTRIIHNVDIHPLNESLKIFEGSHDFAAFANKVDKISRAYEEKDLVLSTIRTIHSITLHDLGEGYYRVDVHLTSALYRMVRNIVWGAMAVASSKVSLSHLQWLLNSAPSRTLNKLESAPPQGLCLEHAYYDHY